MGRTWGVHNNTRQGRHARLGLFKGKHQGVYEDGRTAVALVTLHFCSTEFACSRRRLEAALARFSALHPHLFSPYGGTWQLTEHCTLYHSRLPIMLPRHQAYTAS